MVEFDPARIAGVLQELDADIIALQRIWAPSIDDGLTGVSGLSDSHEALAGDPVRDTRHYGNACWQDCH